MLVSVRMCKSVIADAAIEIVTFFALPEREHGTRSVTRPAKNSVRGSVVRRRIFRFTIMRGQSADILQIGELINIVVAWW